ncbi:hypothetical protein TNCV_4766271 [Trichonephila clavipes]|nr:hypothetical protein TNCV_4766271 [Trichonephila clavipes]
MNAVSSLHHEDPWTWARVEPETLGAEVAKVKKFGDSVPDQRCLILIPAINSQSLVLHSEDISTDSHINRSVYLAMNETWMEDSMAVNLPGFHLIYRSTAMSR